MKFSPRMGYYADYLADLSKNLTGNYFLTTNGLAPYCNDMTGTVNDTNSKSTKKNFFGSLISKIG
jgi:hypothetical protein